MYRQDFSYFVCHGYPAVCDPCQPLYLAYDNCTNPTAFTLTIPYTLPPQTASVCGGGACSALLITLFPPPPVVHTVFGISTSRVLVSLALILLPHASSPPCLLLQGDFTVSLVSGHYFPKEIVVEVAYNFTSSP